MVAMVVMELSTQLVAMVFFKALSEVLPEQILFTLIPIGTMGMVALVKYSL